MIDWRTLPPGREKYQAYLASAEWSVLRQIVLTRDDRKCQQCGEEGTHVHHQTYIRVYAEDPADLILLCESCHENHHNPPPAEIAPIPAVAVPYPGIPPFSAPAPSIWRRRNPLEPPRQSLQDIIGINPTEPPTRPAGRAHTQISSTELARLRGIEEYAKHLSALLAVQANFGLCVSVQKVTVDFTNGESFAFSCIRGMHDRLSDFIDNEIAAVTKTVVGSNP